jgi:hypothetical protein
MSTILQYILGHAHAQNLVLRLVGLKKESRDAARLGGFVHFDSGYAP